MENNNLIKINLKEKIVTLKITDFDTEIDSDDITKIDYGNIMGECLTFPTIMNRIGNLKAEIEELVAETKLDIELKNSELQEYYRKHLTKKEKDDKGKEKISYPTIAEVENAVKSDIIYQNLRKKSLRLQKEYGYVESLYWSANSKDQKLNKFSEKFQPGDFERKIVEGSINGIMIKCHTKLIQ